MVMIQSLETAKEWCTKMGLPFRDGSPWFEFPELGNFAVPTDAGARVALCKALWMWLRPSDGGSVMVMTADRHVWPSGEHTPIVDRWLSTFQPHARIDDYPGLVCEEQSEDAGVSLLILSSLFLWDVWIINASQKRIGMMSHDEFGRLGAIDGADTWIADAVRELRA